MADVAHSGTSITGGHASAVAAGAAGFMTGADKTKLDGLPSAAVAETRTITAGAGLTGGGDLSANRTLDVVANADGSIVANANDIQVGILATDAQHGARGGGTQHSAVTDAAAGFAAAVGGSLRAFVGASDGKSGAWSTALLADSRTDGRIAVDAAQPVNTSGSPRALRVTGAAHTTLTASVEAPDAELVLARTVQFSTGALAAQRAVKISAPTYGFVAASTVSDAATVAISGAPVVGTNATFTRAAALWLESGALQFGAAAARAGDIRGTHGFSLQVRNLADGANLSLLSLGVFSNNNLHIGDPGDNIEIVRYRANSYHEFYAASGVRFTVKNTEIELKEGINSNYAINGNGVAVLGFNIAASSVRNLAFFSAGTATFGGGDKVLFLKEATAVPSTNPTGGGLIYVESGALKYRGTSGTVTTLGVA
jgi:hypothetical protein